MIEIEDEEIFGKVIAGALTRIDNNRQINTIEKLRWVNAIAKASLRIQTSGAFITWQPETEKLLIWSDSNEIYEAGNSCQCQSAFNGNPCWHVAAKRLVELYIIELDQIELNARNARREAVDKSPYLSISDYKPETLGSVRI